MKDIRKNKDIKNFKKLTKVIGVFSFITIFIAVYSIIFIGTMESFGGVDIKMPTVTKFKKPLVHGMDIEDTVPVRAGVATILDNELGIKVEDIEELKEEKSAKEDSIEKEEKNLTLIRCTGYNDIGYTRSGEWTRHGVIAGRYEWLGRECNLYRQNEDGTVGELIGTYEFLDTGYGINGSLEKGTSVDVWHPTEDAVWDWMAEYGDYVYMEFI